MSGDLTPGTVVGAYRIESFLGRGGMGVVYAAEHIALGRRVALKVVAPELVSDVAFRDRFLREARLAASLEHANIIPVHDAGQDGATLYLAMRFVDGENLGAILEREKRVEPARTLRILTKVADALDEAHRNGLVHRDVKPDNILLGYGERDVYLTDFGLVRRLDSRTRLTKTGFMMGTLNYMAPEVLRGEDIDARTDVYSLTCVLFECLAGRPPFARPSEPAVISSHLVDPPPSISAERSELPGSIDAVIARGMAKDRTARFATCGELLAAARAALEGTGSSGGATTFAPPPAPPDTGPVLRKDTPPNPVPVTDPGGSIPPPPWTGSGPQREDAPSGSRTRLLAGGALVALLVVAAILVIPGLSDDEEPAGSTGPELSTGTEETTGPETTGPETTGETGPDGSLPAGVELVTTVEGTPTFIDVDAGAVWVTVGEGTFFRVDKGSGDKTSVDVGVDPVRTSFTGSEFSGDAWVLNRGDGTITRVPLPAGEEPTETIPVGEEPVRAIAPDGTDAVWVTVSGEGLLVRVDADSGETSDIDVGEKPVAVSFSDGALWVANSASGTVSRVSPEGLQAVKEIEVDSSPSSLQPADGLIWVANSGDDSVSVIDPALNEVITEVPVGSDPAGVTNDQAGGVWVQNRGEESISRIDVDSRVATTFEVGAAPVQLTKTGDSLWLITAEGLLFKIEPRTGEMSSLELGGLIPVSIAADVGAVWIAADGGEILRAQADALS